MLGEWIRAIALALVLVAVAAGSGTAQRGGTVIPNQMHTSLTVEVHSVLDEVELYEGDPQYLLQLEVRPFASIPPKTDFTIANQIATLRVRDLSLFEQAELSPEEEIDDPDLPPPESGEPRPVSQGWVLKLMPSSPTDFVLQCDGGRATFDFTSLPVRNVHLLADTTRVEVAFRRRNSVPLERFKLTVRNGRLEMREFLNARARSTTLQVEGSKCAIDLTGRAEDGESEIFIEGLPADFSLQLPRDMAIHVEGPAAIVARFDRQDLVRRDLALESEDYANQEQRLRLYFSRRISSFELEWVD